MVKPDSWSAVEDAKYWTWTCQRQIPRLNASEARFITSLTQPRRLNVQRVLSLDGQRASAGFAADQHLLVVCGNHLVTSLRRLKRNAVQMLSEDTRLALESMRDVLEHWDTQRVSFEDSTKPKQRSARKLVEQFEGANPWSMRHDSTGWWLGGALNVDTFNDELVEVEREVFRRLAELNP